MGNRWIDVGFIQLYRLDRIIFDRANWEFTGRLVSNCSGISLPQIEISLQYRKHALKEHYFVTFKCESLNKEFNIMYDAREKFKDVFESLFTGLIMKMKRVKILHIYPHYYKEVVDDQK